MDLEQARNRYLARVKDPRYTISLPMAQYLTQLVEERNPARILDLGSGLSSSILRTSGRDVWSVEEELSWQLVTHDWLREEGYADAKLLSREAFEREEHGQFDLVFLDMGGEARRMQLLRRAVGWTAPGGVLVVDDGHFTGLHRCCKVYAKIQGYEFADIEAKDEYGRFPMRIDITHEPKQQETCICLAPLRALVCYDEAFMYFMRLAQQGWALVDLPYVMVPMARERIARHLLEHPEFTHTVMLDQDHTHPPDIVHRLGKRADENRDKWVIGALNYRRGPPHDPVGYWINEDTRQYYTVPPAQWGTELREVDALGLSAAIFARECFESFGPPWFDMDWSRADAGAYPGEDTCFSRHANDAGVKLWADPTITSPHLKFEGVDREYHERWVREHPEEIDEDGNIKIDRDRRR